MFSKIEKNISREIILNQTIKILVSKKNIILLLFLISCTGFKANKIEHNEKIGDLYNNALDQINEIEGIKREGLPNKINKKKINIENLKKSITELTKYFDKEEIFKDELEEPQSNAYDLIEVLIKKLKESNTDSSLKKIADDFEISFKKSSPEMLKQIENREILKAVITLIKSNNPNSINELERRLNYEPKLCLLSHKLTKRTILHEAIEKAPKNEGNKKDKNDKNIDKDEKLFLKKLELIIEFIITYFDDKEDLKKAFKTYDDKNKLPLHLAAKKNIIDEFLQYSDDLEDKNDIIGFNDSFENIDNPLHTAFANGSEESALKIVRIKPELIIKTNKKGQNPLHVSQLNYYSSENYLDFILEEVNIADKNLVRDALNAKDDSKKTPLYNFIELLKQRIKIESRLIHEKHPTIKILKKLSKLKNKALITNTIKDDKKKLLKYLKGNENGITKENNKSRKLFNNALKAIESL